jgi:hypothetical protein
MQHAGRTLLHSAPALLATDLFSALRASRRDLIRQFVDS